MRTIITVTSNESSAILGQLRESGDPLDGDQLRQLYESLPKGMESKPGPEDPDIREVLMENDFREGESVFHRAADALALMRQASDGELFFDQIVGAFSVPVRHAEVHGIISQTPGRSVIRLRGAPMFLYEGTEIVLRDLARAVPGLTASSFTCLSKERGSDYRFEKGYIRLVRGGKGLTVLRQASDQGLVDPLIKALGWITILSFLVSLVLHFVVAPNSLGHLTREDWGWLEGWVGRLGSAAIFAMLSGVGLSLTTIQRQINRDGVYFELRWGK
ncbi:MAG TPA: hypothetical protein PKE40_05795 [Arachnia sp.]|nr:hypothetical protein [Arachnia sp.]HMT85848.1 hypothetical protein [Arachnia sp.]